MTDKHQVSVTFGVPIDVHRYSTANTFCDRSSPPPPPPPPPPPSVFWSNNNQSKANDLPRNLYRRIIKTHKKPVVSTIIEPESRSLARVTNSATRILAKLSAIVYVCFPPPPPPPPSPPPPPPPFFFSSPSICSHHASADDMVYMTTKISILFSNEAILTQIISASSYLLAQFS